MGHGGYSSTKRKVREDSLGYRTKSRNEIFKQRTINSSMDPHGITVRESRDSDEHPNSIAIVLALDVTGSMGSVPHFLVKDGLPHIMESIIQKGEKDPQLLFLGIGDHECDSFPLQVGQFESSDELLDKWLTDLYLEGGGGGNDGESYLLAWYFAGHHTAIDCHDKRNRKGFLFTIGDEPVLRQVPKYALKRIMGTGQYQDYSAAELFEKASEKYEVYHIHVAETRAGSLSSTVKNWRQLLGDHLIIAERRDDIAKVISDIITQQPKQADPAPVETYETTYKEEDIIL